MTSSDAVATAPDPAAIPTPLAGAGSPRSSARLAPTEGTVPTNGITLRYLEWAGPVGAGGPPVVLLHGVLQGAEGMANLAAHLARHRRVVAPDLRGRGGSDRPDDGYDPGTMAVDVAGLIEALRLDRPVVVGRLHGGLVAYYLAARRPDLVRGVVLGDTAPEVDPERAARSLARIRALPARFADEDEAVAFYLDRLRVSEARARHDIPFDLEPEPGANGAGGLRWRHDRVLVERVEAAALPRADWSVVAGVTCPTLLLRGQRGEVPPAMADRFCEVIGGCQVQTVLGAGHDVFIGPGAEQSFGAIDLFLMRLHGTARQVQANLAGAPNGSAQPDAQLPLPGAEVAMDTPEGEGGTAAALLERVARAVNSRDADAIGALFAPDGRIVQYGEGGRVRDGGLDQARAAFGRVLAAASDVTMGVRDVVADGERAAGVFVVQTATATADGGAGGEEDGVAPDLADGATLAPAFLRARGGRIAELVTYNLHVPASQV